MGWIRIWDSKNSKLDPDLEYTYHFGSATLLQSTKF